MKKYKNILNLSLILVLFLLPWQDDCFSQQNGDDIVITTQRLSERILVLSETLMGNNVVAVASQKGIVVIDDSGLPSTAAKMRGIIEREFKRNDFVYVINTHSNWDHTFGNQVFPEADIIGHTNVPAGMEQDKAIMPRRIANLEQGLESEKNRLKGLESGSEEARNLKISIQSMQRQINDFRQVFVSTPPGILFNDRMTLDLGDLTVRVYYFGRAHSESDILIHIPEEKILITGDVFLDQRWLPLFAGQPILDIDRWLEVLHAVLDGEDAPVKTVPAHMDLWEAEKLVLWRDYITWLWKGLKESKEQGRTLSEVKANFPLPEPYDYLRERGHSDDRIQRFHDGNIEAFWQQLFISAAETIEAVIAERGIGEARKEFEELKDQTGKYLFSERQFNALGYRLMNTGKNLEAIEIFQWNAALYPESFNVYDSLAEAYMKSGDTRNAIKNYKKSLELNPGNSNANEMLKKLEQR